NALRGEKPPTIRVGGFVMCNDQPVRPLSHWIPAHTAVTEEGQPRRHGFLLRVPLSALDGKMQGWLRTHAKVSSETLQAIELSGGASAADQEKTVEIFSPLPMGQSLWQRLGSEKKLSPKHAIRIGVDIAAALSKLHEARSEDNRPLAHGAIGCDHIWITDKKGLIRLLRDPSSAPHSPHDDPARSWIERIEPTAAYAAPELAEPGTVATPQSDVYSLGCVLYTAILGQRPFPGTDNLKLFPQHRFEVPAPLRQAAEQGAEGDPILRVLAYAMAKDPQSRFPTAQAFADALKRVDELLPGSDSTLALQRVISAPVTPPTAPPAASPKAPQDNESQPAEAPPQVIAEDRAAASQTEEQDSSKVARSEKKKASRRTRKTKAASEPKPPAKPKSEVEAPQPALSRAARDEGSLHQESIASPTASPPATERPLQVASGDATATPVANESVGTAPPSPPPVADADDEPGNETASRSVRRRRKRKKNRVPILAGMMVLPVLMLGLAIALRGRDPQEGKKPRPRPTAAALRNVPSVGEARRENTLKEPESVNGYSVVQSDRLLWVPPHAFDSQPPSLELLPPGPAGIVSISLSRVVESSDWSPLRSAFGTEIERLVGLATSRAGVSESNIQRCTAALFPGDGGWPEVSLAIELKEPVSIAVLTKSWEAFESRTPEGFTVYAGEELDSDAYFVSGGEKGKVERDAEVKGFAVGPLKRIREVAENDGGTIPLTRSLQTLWDQSSSESDLMILMTPNFLFADGRELLRSAAPEFQEPAKRWLIPDVGAVTFAATATGSNIYLELRQAISGGATPSTLLKSFRDVVETWPDWADDFILRSVPDPSWRLLANRLPMMLRFVGDHTRSTIIDDTVVASTYLPTDAAAQVSLASLLAMNTAPGELVAESTPTTTSLSVEDMLNRPMSISFTQESLQFAIAAVSDEFSQSLPAGATMPKVRIIGGDLELSGITQNQQIRGFQKSDAPLRSVLTDLVLGANPDKTATGPKDPKQTLVWVVSPQGKSPSETEILITTRAASEGKYELPSEFVE
ncbi:MAG: hypothetical protein AAFU85_28930, partial [Planctomycetota bacterium]